MTNVKPELVKSSVSSIPEPANSISLYENKRGPAMRAFGWESLSRSHLNWPDCFSLVRIRLIRPRTTRKHNALRLVVLCTCTWLAEGEYLLPPACVELWQLTQIQQCKVLPRKKERTKNTKDNQTVRVDRMKKTAYKTVKQLGYQQIVIPVLLHKFFCKLPKNTISRNYKITNTRLRVRERTSGERVIIQPSVAKHCGIGCMVFQKKNTGRIQQERVSCPSKTLLFCSHDILPRVMQPWNRDDYMHFAFEYSVTVFTPLKVQA